MMHVCAPWAPEGMRSPARPQHNVRVGIPVCSLPAFMSEVLSPALAAGVLLALQPPRFSMLEMQNKAICQQNEAALPASPIWGWQSPPSCSRAEHPSRPKSLPQAAGWLQGSCSPVPLATVPPVDPQHRACLGEHPARSLQPQTNKQQLCKGAGQASPAGNKAQDLLYFNPAKGLLGSEAEPGCAELRMKPYF